MIYIVVTLSRIELVCKPLTVRRSSERDFKPREAEARRWLWVTSDMK
jgi:hypothetical protein